MTPHKPLIGSYGLNPEDLTERTSMNKVQFSDERLQLAADEAKRALDERLQKLDSIVLTTLRCVKNSARVLQRKYVSIWLGIGWRAKSSGGLCICGLGEKAGGARTFQAVGCSKMMQKQLYEGR